MPEGHLLHRYAGEHERGLGGDAVRVTSPQGRFDAAGVLDGLRFERAEAWGKHLFHFWEDGSVVQVHLGQRGLFLHSTPPSPPPRPQVRMRLAGPRLTVDLIAPARCERLDASGYASVVKRLGPDPLRAGVDPEPALTRIARSRSAIGALLLDQSIIAGVGNVLRAEVLHRCGIHPARPARDLSAEERDRLWATLVRVMRQAVDDGRILSVVPEGADRSAIPEAQTRWVYKQERCRRCGTPVETPTLGGRTIYLCPACQRFEQGRSGG